MGLLTVEGTYRDGKVELDEKPSFARDDARVLVTFAQSAEVGPAERREALERLIGRFRQGVPLGGPPYPTREEIHDRVADRKRELR
ncbi:MAG TPA: hypothetical protein VGM51_00865 [Armatimonadota bacterium]|jgi:hypothetical protein